MFVFDSKSRKRINVFMYFNLSKSAAAAVLYFERNLNTMLSKIV